MPSRLLTGRLIPEPWGRVLWVICRPLYNYIDGKLFKRKLAAVRYDMTEEQKEGMYRAAKAFADAGITLSELHRRLARFHNRGALAEN